MHRLLPLSLLTLLLLIPSCESDQGPNGNKTGANLPSASTSTTVVATPPVLSTVDATDVDGHAIIVNPSGRVSLVICTNPDLEDETRTIVKGLDAYRTKAGFNLVRVVDLDGGVPLAVQSVVRIQIREAQDSENDRLKSVYQAAGITKPSRSLAPIVPDFSGDVVQQLHFQGGASHVQAILFDRSGKEIKRLDHVADAATLPGLLNSAL